MSIGALFFRYDMFDDDGLNFIAQNSSKNITI